MTQLMRDTDAVFSVLMEGEFRGDAYALAHNAGMTHSRFQQVLRLVRSPAWIEEYQWTIPFVVRGAAINVWYIADTAGAGDRERMRQSRRLRASELLRTANLNIHQCRLALQTASTEEAEQWQRAVVMHEAVEAHMALLAHYEENLAVSETKD